MQVVSKKRERRDEEQQNCIITKHEREEIYVEIPEMTTRKSGKVLFKPSHIILYTRCDVKRKIWISCNTSNFQSWVSLLHELKSCVCCQAKRVYRMNRNRIEKNNIESAPSSQFFISSTSMGYEERSMWPKQPPAKQKQREKANVEEKKPSVWVRKRKKFQFFTSVRF